ncbi:stabilizer of axonemal microtubules 2, partial [Clarias magur]
MERRCVCEICICGRHRCTKQPTALYTKGCQNCVVTEYTEKYPGYKSYQPRKSLKPKPEERRDRERMDGTTTFRSDFVAYEVSPRPGKKRAEYQPSQGVIDLATTYNQEFGPYKIERVLPLLPKERMRGPSGKVDTVPTYKEDFPEWEITRRELTKPKASYHPPTEKFGNATTFQDDFIPRGLVPRESFKPSYVAKQSNVPFDGLTSNQVDYIPHPVDVHLVKAPCEYKPSDEPMEGLTTHRHDFQGQPVQMTKSCKPEYVAVSSGATFQSSTEFRDRFQPWAVSPLRVQNKLEYRSPTEEMDLNTTTGTTFVKHNVQPFVPSRPQSRPVCSSVPFQGNTTMKEEFKAWKAQRQDIIRKPQEIHRNSGKMEDMSTFRAHFVQHQLQPSVSCKPLAAPLRSGEPMDDETMYRAEFTPKKITVCPASYEPIPGFVFEKVDDRGH